MSARHGARRGGSAACGTYCRSMTAAGPNATGPALLRLSEQVGKLALGGLLVEHDAEAVIAAAEALQDRKQALMRLPPEVLALAANDARELARALTADSPDRNRRALLPELARRYCDGSRQAADAADALPDDNVRDQPDAADPSGLSALSDAYGQDARLERAAARVRRAMATAALLAAAIAAVWSVLVADSERTGGPWARVAGPLLLCVAASAAGLLLLKAANGHDRGAREYVRLQRGLAGLGAYLAPLPAPARHLLRATMAQTLFPRLLDDDDPLRQPEWPDSRDLLYAVYGVPPPEESQPPLPDTATDGKSAQP